METMTWSDDKLEERLERIDERFKHVDQRFDEVNRRITEGRVETGKRFDRIEGDIVVLRAKLDRILIGLLLGFPAVLGTILVKG
jgi:hypothetical protein